MTDVRLYLSVLPGLPGKMLAQAFCKIQNVSQTYQTVWMQPVTCYLSLGITYQKIIWESKIICFKQKLKHIKIYQSI